MLDNSCEDIVEILAFFVSQEGSKGCTNIKFIPLGVGLVRRSKIIFFCIILRERLYRSECYALIIELRIGQC